MSARPMPGIEEHPDLLALRDRYERAAETTPAHAIDGLTFLAGLYLAISPWVTGFSGRFPTLTLNNVFTGVAVALIAVGLTSAFGRMHGLAWVIPVIGLWTIITPWVVSGRVASAGSIANQVVVGLIIVALGMAATMLGMMPDRLNPRGRKSGHTEGSTHRDAGIRDAGTRNSGVRDSGVREPGVREPGVHEPGVHDSGTRDSGLRAGEGPMRRDTGSMPRDTDI